jgi:hypothetical protein
LWRNVLGRADRPATARKSRLAFCLGKSNSLISAQDQNHLHARPGYAEDRDTVRINFSGNADETIAAAEKFLRRNKLAAPGHRMIIVSDVTMGRAMIDSIQLRVLK